MPLELKKDAWYEYIPEALGIRQRFLEGEDAKPLTVELHPLSGGQARAYTREGIAALKLHHGLTEAQARGKAEEAAQKVSKRIFLENVRNVRNFIVDEKEVTDLETFFEEAPLPVVQDIIGALENLSRLEAGRRDRLSSPSAG